MFRLIGRLYAQERALLAAGLLGVFLSVVCLGAIAFRGLIVEPEGNLFKAASFDGAVGIFLLTLGLIVPVAGFSRVGGAIWRGVIVSMAVFGYGVETIQIARGFDPRFSRVSSQTDQMIGGLFFLSANVIFLCFIILMARFFFRKGTPLVVALRYGAVTSLLGFGIGIAMSAFGGPIYRGGGNLLPLHAAGFHGLQAVPLIALALGWAGVPDAKAMRSVHAAGLLWLVLCGGIAWQSFSGQSLLMPSLATAVATLALGLWTLLFARSLVDLQQSGRWPEALRV